MLLRVYTDTVVMLDFATVEKMMGCCGTRHPIWLGSLYVADFQRAVADARYICVTVFGMAVFTKMKHKKPPEPNGSGGRGIYRGLFVTVLSSIQMQYII